MSISSPENPGASVHATQVLRNVKIWIGPIVVASVFAALVAAVYVGSVVNPAGHLHGLPVMIVDQDSGAVVDGKPLNVGASVTSALLHARAVTDRLSLTSATLSRAHAEMDKGGAYATLVIPTTFTRSVLLAAGVRTPGAAPPATAAVQLAENPRLGSLGVSLASGVLTPAIGEISTRTGTRLSALASTATKSNPILASRLANPITLTTTSYHPLPDHSAAGLSAFYIALVGLVTGLLAAILINASIDAALGYSSSQLGPRFTQRRPVAINRVQTFLVKWAAVAVAAPALTAAVVLVAVVGLGMYAPHVVLLWALLTLSTLMTATGTLALIAALGAIGQLLAVFLLVYLSLASSGGTVPIQALPGLFRTIGHVEPLRNTLLGTRAILYFGARGDAGLTTSLIVLTGQLVFWAAIGLGASFWYDHRRLERISPDPTDPLDLTGGRATGEAGRRTSLGSERIAQP
jgi:YhgE/Pip-like protein